MPALILTIILIPAFWLLIVQPQRKRQRLHAELVDSLVAGDRVETFSGIHGTLVEVGDPTVRIEVADGVVVTMARLAVSTRIDEGAGNGNGTIRRTDPLPQASEPTTDDVSATSDGDQS